MPSLIPRPSPPPVFIEKHFCILQAVKAWERGYNISQFMNLDSIQKQCKANPIMIFFYTDEEDLLDVTGYLFRLDKTHIYNLGLVLGLSQHRVKGMKDSETFLDDMIAAWLQKVDQVQKRGVPTWQRLVEALKHDRVGQIGIASKIETEKLHNT